MSGDPERLVADCDVRDRLLLGLYAHAEVDLGVFGAAVSAARRCLVGALACDLVAQPYAQILVNVLMPYADYLEAGGDLASADELRAEADGYRGYLDVRGAADLARTQAMNEANRGHFHVALPALEHAQQSLLEAEYVVEAAGVGLDIADVLEWLGDLDRAAVTLAAVRAAVTELSVADVFGACALDAARFRLACAEGRIAVALSDLDGAERRLHEARPGAVDNGVAAAVDFHLARVARERGDLDAAESIHAGVEAEWSHALYETRRPALLSARADLQAARGRWSGALDTLGQAELSLIEHPNLDLAWKIHARRGKALAELGQPAEALRAYRAGAGAADQLRRVPLGYRLDSTYLRDKLPMFHAAIDLAVAQDDGPAAVWFIELVKARALAAALSVPGRADADPDAARFDLLGEQATALEFRIYNDGMSQHVRHRDELLAERAELLERIRLRDPRWRTITEQRPTDATAIAAQLAGTGRSALALYHHGHRIVAAVLDRDGVTVGQRLLDTETTRALDAYEANLRADDPDPRLNDLTGATGITLPDLLPAEIADRCAGAGTLIVAPHGLLHLLPWATLGTGTGRLFDSTAVGVVPSLATLTAIDSEPVPSPNVVLFGAPRYPTSLAPLPHAESELDDIASIHGDRAAQRWTGPEATRAEFWNAAAYAGSVLHVACHSTFELNDPTAAGLLLAESKVDAADLVMRRIRAAEVILSGCNTGWRPRKVRDLDLIGDDALGLTAAFLEAGARFVLVSVPPASDRLTRRFMTTWHRHRVELSPLVAYQATLRELHDAAPDLLPGWAGQVAYGSR